MEHSHGGQFNNYNRSFAIGVLLNIIFVFIEAGYGFAVDSLVLIADAGHNLSDVASLLLAWGAGLLARKTATDRRTYGFRKVTIMASLISAILLLIALGGIAWEAVRRFFDPQPAAGSTIIIVAAIGVIINTVTALLFIKGQKHDLNIRGAFLHMAADAGVSLGVAIAGVIITLKGWQWIDPLVSLGIVAVILIGTWGLLRDSINYAIDAVPRSIDIPAVREYLLSFDRVLDIHDLHVWPLSTTEIALTVHLVVDDNRLDNHFLRNLQQNLHDNFGIEHATIQVEASDGIMLSGWPVLNTDNYSSGISQGSA
ncbi:cation diffusion facilitator family transporter [Desulfopila inferna]|uniref:cation diffusion facilitator family transporter n=1 Tax=Desulfopila inferna TaxID=468528 RepID=UPI001963D314|nr:cation diffusion facilitator family transporter [Desulfopila inferna]MBM9605205.1 cation transporter [Desulfopila inferna]